LTKQKPYFSMSGFAGMVGCRLRLELLVLAALALCAAAEAKQSYYELLDVPKDADLKAIKKAYREQALKWHPDKNPGNREEAARRFREIAEAYEVLSDPQRRRTYDAGGDDANGINFDGFGGFDFGFKDPKDLFKEMFGSEDPFADFHKFFDDVQTSFEDLGTFAGKEDVFDGGFQMPDMGNFGDFGDLGNMFGFDFSGFEGMGSGGGGSTIMFSSSFSTSSGGKTTKTETRIENGRRVTKTIESDESGTRAMMEEQEGNRIKRTSGSKVPELQDRAEM